MQFKGIIIVLFSQDISYYKNKFNSMEGKRKGENMRRYLGIVSLIMLLFTLCFLPHIHFRTAQNQSSVEKSSPCMYGKTKRKEEVGKIT